MYKYKEEVKHEGDLVLLMYYYLGIIYINEYPDGKGNTILYSKYRVWHPILWILFIIYWIGYSIFAFISLPLLAIRELYENNTDNSNKGEKVGIYKNK